MEKLTENRGLLKYVLLQLVTFGMYGFYLIHRMARETNITCCSDGQQTRGLLGYLVLEIMTLGIYGIIWHCEWISRCNNYLTRNNTSQGLQLSTYLLTLFLFGPMTLGIMYFVVRAKMLYLQNRTNHIYNLTIA